MKLGFTDNKLLVHLQPRSIEREISLRTKRQQVLKLQEKKRIVGAEVDHSEVLEKRFQASLSEGKTPFVVAGVGV